MIVIEVINRVSTIFHGTINAIVIGVMMSRMVSCYMKIDMWACVMFFYYILHIKPVIMK